MRIIKLEIQDFRAFYGNHIIEFAKKGERGKGHNLLLYGENGSGKSSLLLAIKYILESADNENLNFDDYKNIFREPPSDRYIEITLRERVNTPHILGKWTHDFRTTDSLEIKEASQAKGILDYKELLEVHFIHRQESKVNIFDLLVKSLLAQCINDRDTSNTFSQQWENLIGIIPKKRGNTRQINEFQKVARLFNAGLKSKLNELETEISNLMGYFSHSVKISFDFEGIAFNYDAKYNPENKENSIKDKEIFLNIELLNKTVDSPHHFLNEAKLTAIAISIYLSSLLIAPKPKLKLLVLDDIFIGLDMSNRLPLIDIIKEKFNNSNNPNNNYQIFLMTYDREWYEILKQRLDGNKWIYKELYRGEIKIKDDNGNENVIAEVPIWKQDKDYLEKAKDYLNIHHEPRIAAVYLRIAFEVILKQFCNEKIQVIYKEEIKKLSSDDFWKEVKKAKKNDGTLYVNPLLAFDIQLYRNIIMNPLSHSRITQAYSGEVGQAISTVENLKDALFPPSNRR